MSYIDVLDPYRLPQYAKDRLRFSRELFSKLSIDNGDDQGGFLAKGHLASFMFLMGLFGLFKDDLPVRDDGEQTRFALLDFEESALRECLTLLTSDTEEFDSFDFSYSERDAWKSARAAFARAHNDWLSSSAGNDIGEFYFARGWKHTCQKFSMFQILNSLGKPITRD